MFRAVLFALVLALAGCGFRPLYGSLDENSEIGGALAQVDFSEVRGPDVARDTLRETLAKRFPPAAEEQKFEMKIQLREIRQAVSVNIDSTARRFNYTLIARITYTDRETGTTRRQNIQSVASFAVTSSQYASLVAREDAIRRAVIDIARKIEIDAALYAAGKAPATSGENLFNTTSREDPLRRLEDEARLDDDGVEEQPDPNAPPPPVEIP